MDKHVLYVTGCSLEKDGGIYSIEFTPDDGKIRTTAFNALPGVGYLVFSSDRTRLYASVSRTVSDPDNGQVAAFSVARDGSLTLLNSLPSGGLSSCHVVIGGSHLYCANYSSGTFGEFLIGGDGGLVKRGQLLRHEGKSVHPTRQVCAHPHCVQVTPDGRFLAVVDLGCDGVYLYPLDKSKGISSKPSHFCAAEPGDGPRHILFNAAGDLAYIVNELGNSASVYRYAAGKLTHIQTVSSLPKGFTGESTGSAIRMTPDGKRLLVSNRGHESIAIYDVLSDGRLAFVDTVPVLGSWPRDFILFAGARFMAVTNEKSDNVVIFSCDQGRAGSFRHVATASVPKPICALEAGR